MASPAGGGKLAGMSVSGLLDRVDDTPLEEDDLHEVMEALMEVISKWKAIGVAFRLRPSKLREIEEANRGNLTDCLIDILTNWLNRNYNVEKFGEPSWRRVVEVIANSAAGDNAVHAKSIADAHRCVHAGTEENEVQDSLMSEFTTRLQSLKILPNNREKSEQSKMNLLKDAIEDFIERSIQSGMEHVEVKCGLNKVYNSELLFSNKVYEWALEKLTSIPEMCSRASPDSPEEQPMSEMPLFCEDTVYHASLCCYAVSTRDSSNFKDFFNRDFPLHCFEEASISVSRDREDVDRYVIARKGKTCFIAFLSEPKFSQWPKLFGSFEHGIEVQASRIPLRFFIKQLHDGCRIVFTGFSFGAMLALSATASLWKSPLISTSVLEKNLCCVVFSPPLINLPLLQEVCSESPQILSTLHSIILYEDFVPRLTLFLDPRNEEICSESFLNLEEDMSSASQAFQGLFSSSLFYQIGKIQATAAVNIKEAEHALEVVKTLLRGAWPQLLSKRIKADDYKVVPSGCVHLMSVSQTEGLVWSTLSSRNEVLEEVNFIRAGDIDSLESNSFFKSDMKCYHEKVVRCFVKELPPTSNKLVADVEAMKPTIASASFHINGNEVAITVAGDNLWFSTLVKVGPFQHKVSAENTSQKSLQFNITVEGKKQFSGVSDSVSVKVWSQFSSKPAMNTNTEVKRKVFPLNFRQEQLARLTPSEVIETAYLSALLEQQPHLGTRRGFSNRFDALRAFLTKIVDIVPIESLVHAISIADDQETSLLCCRQLKAINCDLPPSFTMLKSVHFAIEQIMYDSFPERIPRRKVVHPKTMKEARYEACNTAAIFGKKVISKKELKRTNKRLLKGINLPDAMSAFVLNSMHSSSYSVCSFKDDNKDRLLSLLKDNPLADEIMLLYLSGVQIARLGVLPMISGTSLQNAYPVRMSSVDYPLKSPLHILVKGREKLQHLVRQATDSSAVKDSSKLSQLYNSKMLEIVNDIRGNELKVCSLLLGAFMEEQIRVPLMKTPFHTARAIEHAASTAALGVWALFSFSYGDVKGLLSAIPSQSLLVEVKEYIKGVFKQDTETADQNYAGKLQFMIQGMDKTVSCNSHYVSYSLERQLVKLCEELKIYESTPLETLISSWDEIFKSNVLSLVVSSHRSLIARWLKWALMVHHLREELACYTSVGVIGLVNSGKSLLVSTLFNVKIPVGTTAIKRTTVPFLYNMNGVVDGLDVIDFPGVDDRDETISDLAELLLVVAQVVIFVVDYKKAHTKSAKKWLQLLEDKSVPVLVCLTYADKLYAECMGKDGSHPDPQHMKQKITEETYMMLDQLGRIPSHKVQFFSFSQDRDSVLNSPDGRSKLQEVGIRTTTDVGDWLADTFEQQLDQEQLAQQLRKLVHREKPIYFCK